MYLVVIRLLFGSGWNWLPLPINNLLLFWSKWFLFITKIVSTSAEKKYYLHFFWINFFQVCVCKMIFVLFCELVASFLPNFNWQWYLYLQLFQKMNWLILKTAKNKFKFMYYNTMFYMCFKISSKKIFDWIILILSQLSCVCVLSIFHISFGRFCRSWGLILLKFNRHWSGIATWRNGQKMEWSPNLITSVYHITANLLISTFIMSSNEKKHHIKKYRLLIK